ncbi:Protein of unknown function [Pyronema omphalodes CBS 100304]|uniref:Uncharacterized protein n=1 Tax=Pyronema omphalodes (strain CBS 100304) TaxID=1076935 RepID=U4LXQ8_PYROM|nr:Protein of unknown function [Pyronema omphalodes CBS 100304]
MENSSNVPPVPKGAGLDPDRRRHNKIIHVQIRPAMAFSDGSAELLDRDIKVVKFLKVSGVHKKFKDTPTSIPWERHVRKKQKRTPFQTTRPELYPPRTLQGMVYHPVLGRWKLWFTRRCRIPRNHSDVNGGRGFTG